MKCSKCGAEIENENLNYCPNCGNALKVETEKKPLSKISLAALIVTIFGAFFSGYGVINAIALIA